MSARFGGDYVHCVTFDRWAAKIILIDPLTRAPTIVGRLAEDDSWINPFTTGQLAVATKEDLNRHARLRPSTVSLARARDVPSGGRLAEGCRASW